MSTTPEISQLGLSAIILASSILSLLAELCVWLSRVSKGVISINIFSVLLQIEGGLSVWSAFAVIGATVLSFIIFGFSIGRLFARKTPVPVESAPAKATTAAADSQTSDSMGCVTSSLSKEPAQQDRAAKTYKADEDWTIFFPDPAMPCRWFMEGKECRRYASGACEYAHKETALIKLLRLLESAKSTLDVCVFTITCNEIRDVLLAAHKRGVKVRIISDDEQALSTGSDIMDLSAAGIPTKTDKSSFHLHHKFAIVDSNVVLTGSFNWTRQAVIGNNENIVVLHSSSIISSFQSEFDKLWREFVVVK